MAVLIICSRWVLWARGEQMWLSLYYQAGEKAWRGCWCERKPLQYFESQMIHPIRPKSFVCVRVYAMFPNTLPSPPTFLSPILESQINQASPCRKVAKQRDNEVEWAKAGLIALRGFGTACEEISGLQCFWGGVAHSSPHCWIRGMQINGVKAM